jgi:hypothetical protein
MLGMELTLRLVSTVCHMAEITRDGIGTRAGAQAVAEIEGEAEEGPRSAHKSRNGESALSRIVGRRSAEFLRF